ncbi:hypothetical protein TSOC_003954 [Tetrabaena socialis]|uniref:Uncharacterized protein n=1 Tax=Tetrabaena socialis TaxID=47790 RepID=A0A2J8AA93_9CHLO|nr:hypothetical protein TSOC_003954 [Tetrabaena socialis]|eukprot:PNH09425.1 hypothetical protein TSOC_003954 [Tetrabaena socialis]
MQGTHGLFSGSSVHRRRSTRLRPSNVLGACLGLCALALVLYGWHLRSRIRVVREVPSSRPSRPYSTSPLLVSYAFYEKDPVQRSNLEFFLQQGWVAPAGGRQPVTWVFVVAGEQCSPCAAAFPFTTPLPDDPDIGVARASRVEWPADVEEGGGWSSGSGAAPGADADNRSLGAGLTLVLRRLENVGMDIASHNASLEYVQRHAGGLSRFGYFFFLNSSVKGPFFPGYLPTWWHWTHAFLERFVPLPQDDPRWRRHSALQVLPADTVYGTAGPQPEGPPVVRAVGASLVCLPEADTGGPGPRLESWAVALDDVALQLVVDAGVFRVRTCKLCAGDEGIVVGGEYGITTTLLKAGHNIATLMTKYSRDVDWRDRRHWGCNDMVHPSRHGTYDGIAFHPYETVFVKSSWHVADPYTRRYGTWMTQHSEGDAGTDGEWNEQLYRYAISPEAQLPNLLEAAYNVTRVRQLLTKQREAEALALEEEERAVGERAMSHDT